MPRKRVEMSFKLPLKIVQKDKLYIASCPVLDVATQGKSKREAKKNLSEALLLFLETCIQHGTLNAVLEECGFRTYKQRPAKAAASKEEYINIPVPLHVQHACLNGCPA